FLFKFFARLEYLVLRGHVRFAKNGLRFLAGRLQHRVRLSGVPACLEPDQHPANRRASEQRYQGDQYLIHSVFLWGETTRFSVTMKSMGTAVDAAGTSFNN